MIHIGEISVESQCNLRSFLYHTILLVIVFIACLMSFLNRLSLIDVKEDHFILKEYGKKQITDNALSKWTVELQKNNPNLNIPVFKD